MKITSILFLTAGLLFVVAALVGKNNVFMPVGICFVMLGVVCGKKQK